MHIYGISLNNGTNKNNDIIEYNSGVVSFN